MSDTICVLPWIHINSSVTGKVRPCCNTQKYFSFTDRDMTLKEAFVSDEMNELRQQMLNGEKPDICSVCWKNEELGIRSQRERNNRKFDMPDEPTLQFLDVKFDNVCNLQCRMCDPYSSNQIWKTLKIVDEVPGHLQHIKMTEEEYNARDNSEARKQFVLDSLPELTFLKCTGGEPFVSKHFVEVLEKAVETGHAEHITLSITTNGTKFTNKITQMFSHFKAIDINISVDGCGETYDYIRFPFTWNQWKERVIDFLTDMEDHPNFSFRFSTVVTAYNYLNLCDLQKELDAITGFFVEGHRNSFDFDLKPENSELHAKFLPPSILIEECEKAKQLFNIKYKVHPLNNIFNFAHTHQHTEEKRKELKRSAIILDNARNQSYQNLHPKLVEWLNE